MHFGEPLGDDRFLGVIRHAYEQGIRTFMTADVYGNGQADEILGRALQAGGAQCAGSVPVERKRDRGTSVG